MLCTAARGRLAHVSAFDVDQLAEDCAQDAMLAILEHLPEFRGDSRFTTWAHKFAINMVLAGRASRSLEAFPSVSAIMRQRVVKRG